jgi:hypothetical protein
MTYDEWIEKYRPIKNPLNPDAPYDGTMFETYGQEYEEVFNFQFVLLNGKDKDESLRGRNLFANFVPSYLYISTKNGKNALYEITEALLGHSLTPKEEAEMDGAFLNSLIGKQVRVGVKNKPSKTDASKIYSNIETYYSADDLLPALTDKEKEEAKVKPKEEGSTQTAQAKPVETDDMIADGIIM